MNLLFGLILGLTIGVLHPYAIGIVGAVKDLAEQSQNEDVIRKPALRESPSYPVNEQFYTFYPNLYLISWHLEKIYDLSEASDFVMGLTYAEYMSIQVGIDFGSLSFIRSFAFNLSEISSAQDVSRLISDVFHEEVPAMVVPSWLQIVKDFIVDFRTVNKEFRDVYKEVYRWAKKTNFPYDFPLQHTSVEEVEGLMRRFQRFVTNADADEMLLDIIPKYESMYRANSAMVNHEYAVKLIECKSFMEFLTSVLEISDVQMWQRIQKGFALLQSEDIKFHVMGLSHKISRFLELLDLYGILDVEITDY